MPFRNIDMRNLHNNAKNILIFTFIVCISTIINGQTVKDLENQRKQTLKKLETTTKILNETKKSQQSSLNKLNIISKNIKERKTLIKDIGTEIGKLDSEMEALTQQKIRLENNLVVLKKDYAKLVREAHYNRSMYAKIMFILSAESFDQSIRRLRYLQEYTEYRKTQVRKIEHVTVQIASKNDSLKIHKNSKEQVVKQKKVEAEKLTKDEKKEKGYLTDLKKKESKLRADLKIQQKKAADLNNKIERMVAEAIRKAEAKKLAEKTKMADSANDKKSSVESTKKTSTTKTSPASKMAVSTQTKEETLVSGDFERNKGRLPWPTANGFIRGHFGLQNHPVLKFVQVNNKGIYIQTPSGTSARAVFDGVVTSIFYTPGSNSAIIIKHGKYFTVYGNLTQITVSEGQKVSAKQPLGRIFTDSENDNKTELYFQIRNGLNIQNPESWIAH